MEGMRLGLRLLKPTMIQWLRAALGMAEVSRQALARELCEREALRNRRRFLCVASAAKALPAQAWQSSAAAARASITEQEHEAKENLSC